MSNEEAIENLVGLMTSFHFEIKALPDDLKCTECKSVLKNACQMPCECRFCRACIDDVISRGHQFCPGGSQECGATHLSTVQRDYRANKSVLKLTAKCPHGGCQRECPLADIEDHMHACPSKHIDCPFRELGCAQGALPGEEMSGHLMQDSRSHSEILIGTVANISRDVKMLKRELLLKDEHMENEMKLIKYEMKSMKIENESIKDENESIKIENESIKREKEVLFDQVGQLSEKLERGIAMVTAVTAAIASNRDEMEPVRGDIRSIRDEFDCMKCQIESIRVTVGLEQVDDWLIKEDVAKTSWGRGNVDTVKFSISFGFAHAFQLSSSNSVSGGELRICLLIWAYPSDAMLEWPFRGAVTITVADRETRETCSKQMRQCEIERPEINQCSASAPFVFRHDALKEVGVDLEWGVSVSCRIVPARTRESVSSRATSSPVSSTSD